jgi:hypothetical protein
VLLQRRIVEAEPAGDTLAEVLHEDVGFLDQAIDDLARFGLLQIDSEAAFVAVVGLEIEIRPIAEIDAAQLGHAAAGVAADAFLDLDHIRAEVAEHGRAYRALLPDGPIDDADSLERHGHVTGPPVCESTVGKAAQIGKTKYTGAARTKALTMDDTDRTDTVTRG